MTPSEKAKNLYELMYYAMPRNTLEKITHETAKICARICVDEIVQEIERLEPICEFDFPMAKKYWEDVKTHIQQL